MILTGNPKLDSLLYSYIGIRLLSYSFFFILNLYQTISEGLTSFKNSKKSTRFFIFLSLTLFCAFRIISTAMFYSYPLDWEVGTVVFIFFSIGTQLVFICWIFILKFWLIVMYSFFVSEEVRLHKLKPINWVTGIFIVIVVVYTIITVTLGMFMELGFGEAIGFLVLLIIFGLMIIIFGAILLKSLKKHKKNASHDHFQRMIKKTKILLSTVTILFVVIVIEEIIYKASLSQSLSNSIQSNFITGVADTIQMIVVMYVMANGRIKNYLLFKRVKIVSQSSNEKTSFDSSSKNRKFGPSYDNSRSTSYDVDMDASNSVLDIVVSNSMTSTMDENQQAV